MMPAPTWQAIRCGDAVADLAESPFWDGRESAMWWVDIPGQRLFRTQFPSGATQSWATPEQVGFVATRGSLHLVGMERGIYRFDAGTADFSLIEGTELAPGMRFNDATMDASGRLWASTMRLANDQALGALYLFELDWTRHLIAEGLRTPNGLAFDAERSRLYWSDSHPSVRSIWSARWSYGDGLTGQALLARLDGESRPDGAALDASGNYWIACLEASALMGFSPDGTALRRVAISPRLIPTKLAFGPANEMFITSKTGEQPGGLFRLVPPAA